MQIHGFLVVFRKKLNPTGILHRHGIGMVVPNIDGRSDRAVADSHDDRKAQTGGIIDSFGHIQEALARRRGIGSRTGSRGADNER